MDVFVETERLVLRRFTADDLELLVELDSDPEVKRYIDGGAPVEREDVAAMLSSWLHAYDRDDGYGFWAVVEKASGVFLGWFHLRPGKGAGPLEPELGYRLRREAWGRGYATEGSRALIDKAFVEFGAERVDASTMTVNPRVATRNGEGQLALRADVRRRLARQGPRRRARRCGVRHRPDAMGGRQSRRLSARSVPTSSPASSPASW